MPDTGHAGFPPVVRGRVLRPLHTPVAPRAAGSAWAGSWKVPALAVLLPMFYQAFQYMIDLPPLYALSKGWPLVTFPVALWGLFALRLPHTAFYVVLLAYLIGLSPALSMLQLFNDLVEAAATTTKIWSFSFYFSFSAVLYWIRPEWPQLRRAVLTLGLLTFGTMWALWLFAPLRLFAGDPKITQVFYTDLERGYRIVLPMGMALVGTFYVARLFAQRPRWWHALLIAAAFGTMIYIYKQRLAILSALAMTVFAATSGFRARRPLLAYGLLLAGLGLGIFGLFQLPDRVVQGTLGNSLGVRQISSSLAWDFIRDDPLRLLFGVGATTNVSTVTLQDILHYPNFFTTDIGWLGVLFEYGLVGSTLIAGAYVLGILLTRRAAAATGDPLMQALSDWTVYLMLVTSVYSVIYTPGEVATASAIAVYALRRGQGRDQDWGQGWGRRIA